MKDYFGFVYIVHIDLKNRTWNNENNNLYKIGQTVNPKQRAETISAEWNTSKIVACHYVQDRLKVEFLMHHKFDQYVCNHPLDIQTEWHREFFLFPKPVLNEACLYLWKLSKPYFRE